MIDAEAFSCQELVELVTDYLEGALDPATCAVSRSTGRLRQAARATSTQFRATIRAGRITPRRLTPAAEAALLDVFRLDWRRLTGRLGVALPRRLFKRSLKAPRYRPAAQGIGGRGTSPC